MSAGNAQSEVAPIEEVVLKHARDAFVSDERIDDQWRGLHYQDRPDLEGAVEEYTRFAALLGRLGVACRYLPRDDRVGLDSIYVRDASIVCDRGVVLCNMGKADRCDEPRVLKDALRAWEIPVLGAVTGAGRVEGGDVVWLDRRTLAVGRGYRTNDEGIRQLETLLADCLDELHVVPLPHWRGPDDVFHLMSILSPVDVDLALVYSPLMPVSFREALTTRGVGLVEVPDEEFETMGCNVLAVAPRRCVVLAGNPVTRARLERAGVEVHEFDGTEISAKGAGGPTCLTRPLRRS